MDKYISNSNISLLLPVASISILLLLHCYLYRGRRLTLAFFACIILSSYGREMAFCFLNKTPGLLPYIVKGNPFKIFNLPLVVYMGWAITFYLSWYLAERILRRIGRFSDRIFPTIVWSILIAGAISYCVEASAIRAGWWLWTFPDPRLKDFLIVPFSALEGWSAFAASFFLIFFLAECSQYRKQWWRVFLYFAVFGLVITVIVSYIAYIAPSSKNVYKFTRIFDTIRILLPIILMFFWPMRFKYERLDSKNSKRVLFLYDAIPLVALFFILIVCIVIDIAVLHEPLLLFSTIPLICILLLSIIMIPVALTFSIAAMFLIIGNKLAYSISLPLTVFFIFWFYKIFNEKFNINLFPKNAL